MTNINRSNNFLFYNLINNENFISEIEESLIFENNKQAAVEIPDQKAITIEDENSTKEEKKKMKPKNVEKCPLLKHLSEEHQEVVKTFFKFSGENK